MGRKIKISGFSLTHANRRMFGTFVAYAWLLITEDGREHVHIVAPARPTRVFVR